MDLNELTAVSPVDGRYGNKTLPLRSYFSEAALIAYRVRVEVRYFLALCEVVPQLKGKLTDAQKQQIERIAENCDSSAALRVKAIEKETNHDVKAVEYYIKEQFADLGLSAYSEFVHFGLTSQDINNTAFPMMMHDALTNSYLPLIEELAAHLEALADEWKAIPMLAHTHGQPASPTRLGKEIGVFAYRLRCQLDELKKVPITAKFGGATGNFNAHHVAYPDMDWIRFADQFVASLGLKREALTTQISNYDYLAALFQAMERVNTILIDLARDVWSYISMGYFRQKIKAGEVGSSAMPHKVNPIDFENAEGNLMIANAYLEFLARKLPVSRLQRDLTDSTVIRNEGMPVAYALIAFTSLQKGLGKLIVDEQRIVDDLSRNYEVVAEAIQTILRREGYPHPYEALKLLTRTGRAMDENTIRTFVNSLELSDAVKEEILRITPLNYLGL